MKDPKKIIAVLDANVLYPAPLRDFLLRLAQTDLFSPRWSSEIHHEWTRNLLKNRPDLKAVQLERTCHAMDSAFAEANVMGYKNLLAELELPDKDDRHVLAVAIKSAADTIITFNKKDFPVGNLKLYGIDCKDPDEFIVSLLKSNLSRVLVAFERLVNALKNPPQNKEQVLNTLQNCGLKESVVVIRKIAMAL